MFRLFGFSLEEYDVDSEGVERCRLYQKDEDAALDLMRVNGVWVLDDTPRTQEETAESAKMRLRFEKRAAESFAEREISAPVGLAFGAIVDALLVVRDATLNGKSPEVVLGQNGNYLLVGTSPSENGQEEREDSEPRFFEFWRIPFHD